MWTDPIIEDLHAQRRAHAAEYGFDVKRLLAALHAAQDRETSQVDAPLVQPAPHSAAHKHKIEKTRPLAGR